MDTKLEQQVKQLGQSGAVLEEQVQEQPNEKIKEVNTRIQCFLINYSRYIDLTMLQVKKGKDIDEKAIYALNDAVRTIAYIKKILE